MGVPKFFRWISERYPNLSVNIDNNQMPTFDCLYLDMNGIIHICSHPDDTNVHFRITEEQIFINVFKYIEFLFKTVKPKEVFFLAVDGVAPRAKMNQQRARRFKSAKEAKDRDNAAILNGVKLPTEKRFDSNAITPGTEFMDRLQQGLKSFLAKKISSDQLWHGVDVILSGHETPGEGEHKIQEFIRYKRSLPDYNPNTRHCLYGLDADLMLLGLASHEPYFSLLREEVTFSPKSKGRRAYIAEETKFYLLHLSLLRDYIDYEFNSLKEILNKEYDLERIIDDWIVMSFFVGNDFVPHLPNIHIHTSALPLLWQTYMKVRPQLNGYLNEYGKLNITNILTYVTELSSFDHRHFEEMFEDMKWMFGKSGEKMAKELDNLDKKATNGKLTNNNNDHEINLIDFEEADDGDITEENIPILSAGEESLEGINIDQLQLEENDDGGDIWKNQFHLHKTEYYYTKLGLKSSPEILAEQAKEYFIALQWISYYYFSGVPSWSWFYPQHYAPFVSDLVCLSEDIKNDGINFDIGTPFLPFEQLMAVLPSDSAELLPDCFSILMTMENSKIIDFYPKTFKSDLNGKKREWEAVILIPFIDENRLLSSLNEHKYLLSGDETKRNVHGPHLKFRYSQKKLTITEIDTSLFKLSRESIVFGLCRNVQLDVICQGFPTFKHIPHTFSLERAFVKVFENVSTFESIVLKIIPSHVTAEDVAINFLEKLVYVNWPAFILSKVVAVLIKDNRITLDPVTKELVTTPLKENEIKRLNEYIVLEPQELHKRRAINIDQSNTIVLEGWHSEGSVYEIVSSHKAGCNVRLERNWVKGKLHWHLHQLAVLYESIDMVKSDESKACTKLNQLFPIDGLVFCLDNKHYGQSGKIQSINNLKGSITVKLDELKEPNYIGFDINDTGMDYMNASQACEYLDIDALLLSKITGSIYINMSKVDNPKNKQKNCRKDRHSIGLDLKNNKLNLQVPGWVIKSNIDNGCPKWLYSMKVVKVLDDYRNQFPEVFEFIRKPNFESLTMEDLFEIEGNTKLLELKYEQLKKYLDSLEYRNLEKLSNDHKLLTESQIKNLEDFIENPDEHTFSFRTNTSAQVELQFKELYRSHYSLHGTKPDMTVEYQLLDRVICITDDYTVPLGHRGVVIGIEPLPNDQIKLEILFDNEFLSAISIRGSKQRCYRMPPHTLINTSHGLRKFKCIYTIVGKMPINVEDNAIQNTSNSFVNLLTEQHNKLTEVTPLTVNHSSSSDLLTALFATTSTKLPPMPSKKFCENKSRKKSNNIAISEHCNETLNGKMRDESHPNKQMEFLAHCDVLFKNTVKKHTSSFNLSNCPNEYKNLLQMCINCGIVNATIMERNDGDDIFISFKCENLNLPESIEKDLLQGRVNYSNQVWNYLYSQQQPYPRQEYSHYYEQFQENPFTQLYPSHTHYPPVSTTSPPSKETTKTTKKSNGDGAKKKVEENVIGVNTKNVKPEKPFIQAPRRKMTFPNKK